MADPPQWDVGRRRRRPSERRLGANAGRLKDLPFDHPDFPHGPAPTDKRTPTGYRYGCRCDLCKLAYAEYRSHWYRTSSAQTSSPLDDPKPYQPMTPAEHGTRSMYVKGCRCDSCKEANRSYQREYMAVWRAGGTMADAVYT